MCESVERRTCHRRLNLSNGFYFIFLFASEAGHKQNLLYSFKFSTKPSFKHVLMPLDSSKTFLSV